MSELSPTVCEPFFLPFGKGNLFCIFHAPKAEITKGAILYLHPFAEEMHKSRRMAALQARRFAASGYAVLQVDLPGCGDSFGDFADADWDSWLASALSAYFWLRQRTEQRIALWGLRTGATLALELSCAIPEAAGIILWQPVINGERFLNQFLRIKIASEMLSERPTHSGTQQIRNELASGKSVEVGGYLLSSKFALEIDRLRLSQYEVKAPIFWFELLPMSIDLPPKVTSDTIQMLISKGAEVKLTTLQCDPFWTTQEIHVCEGLLRETTQALQYIFL